MDRRIKKTFGSRGIEIPFPHQWLYCEIAEDATASPLRVAWPGDVGGLLPTTRGQPSESDNGRSRRLQEEAA